MVKSPNFITKWMDWPSMTIPCRPSDPKGLITLEELKSQHGLTTSNDGTNVSQVCINICVRWLCITLYIYSYIYMGRHNMYIWVHIYIHIYIYYTIRVSRKQTHPQMNVSMTWIFSTCGQSPLARIMSSNNVITCHLRCWVHKSSSRTISFLVPEVWFFIAFHIPFLSARLSGFCAYYGLS